MNNAIYEVINNGENSYYYTHHGGNCVTGPLRLDQAIEYAQHNDIALDKAFEAITYSNEFMTAKKSENVFEKINADEAMRSVRMSHWISIRISTDILKT